MQEKKTKAIQKQKNNADLVLALLIELEYLYLHENKDHTDLLQRISHYTYKAHTEMAHSLFNSNKTILKIKAWSNARLVQLRENLESFSEFSSKFDNFTID